MIEDRATFGNLTDFPEGSAAATKIKKDGTVECRRRRDRHARRRSLSVYQAALRSGEVK